MRRDEDLWTAAGRPMRPRSPSPHYTHAPSQLTDQSSLCGFNAPSMVQRMSGLVQRLRDLCCWWSLELLRDEKAHQQGLRLLKQNLSPSQRIQLEMLNYFDVVGGKTGTLYRIHLGDRMNIAQLDTSDNRVRGICFLPQSDLPVGDTMLAQKLALELFEIEALRVATHLLPWEAPYPPYHFR